jgi:hypothetical protein
LHRSEVSLAGHRKAGLDHINPQPGELAGDFEFLAGGHRGAGTLLAIAERRVKNNDTVVLHSMFRFGGVASENKNPTAGLAVGFG